MNYSYKVVRNFDTVSINLSILSWSSSLAQLPSCFIYDPTINISAKFQINWILFGVIPLPTATGILTFFLASNTSLGSVGSPVAVPVIITPSAPKNSAAFAVSPKLTSLVIECAECFFFLFLQKL